MKYTDLTNEELDGLLELAIAAKEGKVSMLFFKSHITLLETAVFCRKTKTCENQSISEFKKIVDTIQSYNGEK
jgi:hypothetical protein